MNLQEAIGYRTKCIICQKDMIFTIDGYPNLSITLHDNGLRIRSGHKNGIWMFFNFDGSWRRNRRHYKIYSKSLVVTRRCPDCYNKQSYQPPMILKARSHGPTIVFALFDRFTSLNNATTFNCSYEFIISKINKKRYEAKLSTEIIRYCDRQAFYHLVNDFTVKGAQLIRGNFVDALDNILFLKLPLITTGSIQNTEQLLNKFKLLALFS